MLYIETSKIHPHPDNPRKELGDLTELAESIKEQGILQNLTVIPEGEEDYLVVIGHRRLAAAKLAGLEKVPCVISDMDHKTQVATMLLENIQRQDLTALGIKMPENLSTWTQEYKDKKAQKIAEKIEIEGALKVLAVNVFSVYEPNFNRTFYQDCVYQAHLAQKHKTMYDFLESIGYEMSSEEKQIVDGTHELYTVLPEDEDDEV